MITVLHGAEDRLVSVDNLDYLERKLGTELDAKPDTNLDNNLDNKLGADLGADLARKQTYQLIREEAQGHFLIWERPDLVRQAILQQLAALVHAEQEQAQSH
jgi:pimeloyl-ACP methyl ester carboxylesterase